MVEIKAYLSSCMTDLRNLLSVAPNNVNEPEGDLTFGSQYGYEEKSVIQHYRIASDHHQSIDGLIN